MRVCIGLFFVPLLAEAFQMTPHLEKLSATSLHATTTSVAPEDTIADTRVLLDSISAAYPQAQEWSDMFGLGPSEAAFYALFSGIRNSVPLGLRGRPFVLQESDIQKAMNVDSNVFSKWFDMNDLEKAVNDDFLDADRGSTDNRKGWQVASVSTPRGNSFEDAKMLFSEVQAALERGTVIFNSAGAHICKLAGANLATVDATSLPCAINIYITAPNQRTSAPPHTDKQDVIVVQTCGRKHWRVYSPPDPSLKPSADMFARGKHTDHLPLYALESDLGCKLLLETTLEPGDVLFIPAAFPHTTSTADQNEETSIHLTFGLDTHVWDLDYLSLRRFALRRAGVVDTALGQTKDEDNRYVGAANELPENVRVDLFDALPIGLLDDTDEGEALLQETAARVEEISREVDFETASQVDSQVWKDTAARVRQEGMELLEIHRDMFVAAIEEGRVREAEDVIRTAAHLDGPKKMTPERMERLSCFRVKKYFDKINDSMKAMLDWSKAGVALPSNSEGGGALPEDWAFTHAVNVGDTVEADLGGAFFSSHGHSSARRQI
jgi:hypothetical protein